MAGGLQYLLVDGHSIIYAWPLLSKLHKSKPAAAREKLISLLQQLHDFTHWRITVVFDGRQGNTPIRTSDGIVVAYSQQDESADSIIERMVSSFGVADQIMVVTADHAEKRTVEALGAHTASPDWLEAELERAEADLSVALKNVQKKAKW